MAPRIDTLLLIALLVGPLAAQEGPKAIALGLHGKDFDEWSFSLGREFPGAHGNLWQTPEGVAFAGEFWKGGNYVSISRNFAEPVDVKALVLEIRSEEAATLGFRITDSTGQVFQQRLSLSESPGWQRLAIRDLLGKKDPISWGGAKDGKWHGPAKSISFLLDRGALRDREKKQGKIFLRSVLLECP